MNILESSLKEYPIIASVKNLDDFNHALNSRSDNIFLLTGNIFNLRTISDQALNKNKNLFLYIDNIEGFSKDTWGFDFIAKNIPFDGIISSKGSILKLSKEMGIFTMGLYPIYNSMEMEKSISYISNIRPHIGIVSPGIVPEIIREVSERTHLPLIASGFIRSNNDVKTAMDSGAIGVATSCFMDQKIFYP